MSLKPITPLQAQGLLGDGAKLIDIRSPQEFASAALPGSDNQPLGSTGQLDAGMPVIFVCRTGKRTEMNQAELSQFAGAECYRLDGGIEGWREAGLPVTSEADNAASLEGNALTVAGVLVIVGVLFGWVQSAWWLLLAAAVATDMIYTGIKGRSMIAAFSQRISGMMRKDRQEP